MARFLLQHAKYQYVSLGLSFQSVMHACGKGNPIRTVRPSQKVFLLEAHAHAHVFVAAVVVALHHEGVGAVEEVVVLEASHSDGVHAGGGVLGDDHVVVAH